MAEQIIIRYCEKNFCVYDRECTMICLSWLWASEDWNGYSEWINNIEQEVGRYKLQRAAQTCPNSAHTKCACLRVAHNTVIPTYGQRLLTLDLGIRRQFPFVFVIAQIPHPILSIDFIQHFDILVDVRSRKLIDRTTTLMVIGKATSINSIGFRLALPPISL